MAYDEETAERVRRALSGRRDVVEKKLMGGLSFMVTGGMCCSVSGRGGLLVRIGEGAHESMLGEPHVQPMGMGRRVMTSFVRVAPEGYRTDAALKKWLARGLDAVAALKAKPAGAKRSRAKASAKPRRKAARQKARKQ
jgi:TfoX/Sxy family transcriptional regulator of competence genes